MKIGGIRQILQNQRDGSGEGWGWGVVGVFVFLPPTLLGAICQHLLRTPVIYAWGPIGRPSLTQTDLLVLLKTVIIVKDTLVFL